MRVADAVANGEKLLSQQIRIEGYFVYAGVFGYLVDSVSQRDDFSQAVLISVDNLKQAVAEKVPPSGGSKYYYLDTAVLQGELQKGGSGFAYQCANVKSFEVTKAGIRFVVVP